MTPEGKVKDAVKKVLKKHGIWYFMPMQNGFGVVGVPDFICCFNGAFLGVETKAPGKREQTTPNQNFPLHPPTNINTQHSDPQSILTTLRAPDTPEKTSEQGYARLQEQYKALRITSKVLEDCNRDLTKENERLIQENLNLRDDLEQYKSALQDQLFKHEKADHFGNTAKNLFKDKT